MGPPKFGAPGNCPICPPLKPALTISKFNNTLNKNNYTKARNIYTNKIRYTKRSYSLHGRTIVNQLPDLPDTDLPAIFASFFEKKVSKLISTLPRYYQSILQPTSERFINIDQFLPPTIFDLSSLLKSSKKSSPTIQYLLKSFVE